MRENPPFINPTQEIEQGNGIGPQVWDIKISAILQTLHDICLATKIIAPIFKEQLKLCGFTFVEVSDIIADTKYANNSECKCITYAPQGTLNPLRGS